MSFSSDMLDIAIAESCNITEIYSSDLIKKREVLYKKVVVTTKSVLKKLKPEFPGVPNGFALRDWNIDKADKFPVEDFANGKESKIGICYYVVNDYVGKKDSNEKRKEFAKCLQAFINGLKEELKEYGTIKSDANKTEGQVWFIPGPEYK